MISNLDLSNNNKIGIVYLKNNELKNIAFPDVAHLSTLDLAHNYLEKLKLPVPYNQFGHLTLNLSDNLLKELDLSDYENYTIDTLYLSNNNFSNIDFSKFNIKEKIDIRNNKLVSLDLSSSDDIEMVIADNNYINQVNFTNNSNITYLSLNNNKLETINLENNINIKNLKLSNNKLETINLKNNINIKELELYNNSLASLILSNSNIQNLYISNNKLTNMTIPNLEYLEVIIANNNLLKELDLSSATSLKKLDLSNNNLNKININDSSNITDIILNNNLISDVKLPIANIKNLDLSNNNLTYIDLSTLSLIGNATINLNDNKFTSIDENWFKLNGITDDISDRIAIYIKNNPIIKNSTAIYKTDNISSVDISSEIKNMNIPNFYSYEYLVSIDTSFKDYLEKNNMNQSELDVKNANWVNPSYYKINNAIGGSYEIEYINEIKKQANDSLNKYKETQYTITFGFKQIVNILELSSEKYIIDDVNNIINIGKDKISTDILNNINLNIGKLNVSSNKVQLIYDDKIVKEYEIESNYEIMQPDDLTISNIIVDNVIDDSNKFYSTYNSNISFETSFKNNHSINDLNFIITNNEEDVSSKFNIDIKGNQIIISNKSIVEDGLYKINIYDNDKLLTAIELEVVNPIPVKDIVCNEINVAVNQSLKINYYVLPDDATNKKVKFEVSDTSIINVNDDGTLVGLKSGTTQLKLISAENNNIYKEITVNVFVADILSNNFNIDYNNKIIKEINDKLDFDLFKSMIETSNIIKMFDGEKEFISSSIFVGTGKEIRIYNNETLINTYKLSISGDVNGDGKILANDILIQKLHILNKSLLMDEYLMAGDINNDGKVNALDILYLKRYILGKTENVWDKK